jgi:hypothetical protein
MSRKAFLLDVPLSWAVDSRAEVVGHLAGSTRWKREDFMQVTEEDFRAIIDALSLLYRPEEHGCHFDFGDENTRHERVGRIIQNLSATARAILVQAAPVKKGPSRQAARTTLH